MKQDKYSENLIIATEKGKSEKEYWTKTLQDETTVTSFPKDYYTEHRDSTYSTDNYKFPNKVWHFINKISNGSKYAAYMVLLASVNYLLNKYTSNECITIGMPAFKQKLEGIYTENILPLKVEINKKDTFKSLLGKIKNIVLEADKNQNIPLDRIAKLLNLQAEGEKYRFSTMVGLRDIHIEPSYSYINVDLSILFTINEEGLEVLIKFNSKCYKKETIDQIFKHLVSFYEIVSNYPDILVCDIEILSKEEKKLLLEAFNNTNAEYSREKTINKAFEEQVKKTPCNTALVYGDMQLTYEELNKKANQFAHMLREKGVKQEDIVAIITERSINLIVGILGIIKAGAGYLPIDSEYPKDRIKYMLEDSGAKLVLTTRKLMDSALFEGEAIDIEDEGIYSMPDDNPSIINSSSNIAYVIYTSGSTGKPKGVILEHKGIINLKEVFCSKFGITDKDRVLQFASSSFDASVWEIFMAMLNGAALCLVDKDTIENIREFEGYLNKNKITVVTLPPSYLANLDINNIKSIRKVFTAGSSANKEVVKNWNHKVEYINAYGPTEASICTTSFLCDSSVNDYSTVPIGKPINNTRVLIIDKYNKLSPIGVAGELCISGDTLARGYLNRPELTAEKFVSNPYLADERMYRTGDLARWLSDGNIEFLGRIDYQVKIRGYRIELGEIEAQLLKHDNIKEVLVIDKESNTGDKFLCAYIVCKTETSVNKLRDFLSNSLPVYMIPAFFVILDKMPLTPNGKIDRKQLPEPADALSFNNAYEAPRNETEEAVAQVWQDILGVKRVGINDSFFELGGDSIKALQVLSRLNKFNLKFEIKDLFKYKTIEALSQYIVKSESIKIEQEAVNGTVQLTPIQQWFFDMKFINMNHWNQSVMLYGKNGFDEQIIKKVFDKITVHHDALRMTYKIEENSIRQYNRALEEGEAFILKVYNLTEDKEYKQTIENETNKLQGSISLENGPLLKLALFRTTEGDHLLVIVHHLVVDGVSWRIILEDFFIGYNQILNNQELKFQAKTHSFKEWAFRLTKYAEEKEIRKQIEFWSRIENTEIPILPTDMEQVGLSKQKDIETIELRFNEQDTRKLLKEINKTYNTEINDILVTALGMTIKGWTDNSKVLVGLEGHGRENIINGIDINRTVGWFTSQYPVILDMSKEDTSFNIRSIKETLRSIPDKGIGYGILRYNTSKINKDISFNRNPEICFNYLGQFGEAVNTDLFGISSFSTGQVMNPLSQSIFKLNINGMITDKELVIAFSYSTKQYNKETIISLSESYRDNILRIIEHCASKYEVRKEARLTPSDLGIKYISLTEFDKIAAIWGNNLQSVYPLTSSQAGMLFYSMLDKISHAYFEQTCFTVKGKIDVQLFEKSYQKIIERHDALRTNFIYLDVEKPLQVVTIKKDLKINFIDLTGLRQNERESYIEKYKADDRSRGFDLSKDTLLRLSVLMLNDNSYEVIWSFHHIIMDGWGIAIINKEFLEIYNGLLNNKEVFFKKIPSYKEHVYWLLEQDKEEARSYWTDYMRGYENLAEIPKSAIRADRYIREELDFIVDEATTRGLLEIAKQRGSTINTMLQAIWGILLQKYSNSNDVVFGLVTSGRNSEIENIEEMIGLFINTIPVRVQSEGSTSFISLLDKMQQNALTSEQYSYYPLQDIRSVSPLKSSAAENALFDHIVIFENYPIQKTLVSSGGQETVGFSIEDVRAFEQTNFDLTFEILTDDKITIKCIYNAAVFSKHYIKSICKHIKQAGDVIIEEPNIPIEKIDFIPAEEKKKILEDFNKTEYEYPRDKTIYQIFEEQTQKTPDAIAVKCGDNSLTYRQLNQKANQLARQLRKCGVVPDSITAVMLERSIDLLVSMLAIFKSGGAYLPIDPEYPKDRIEYMLEDSSTKVLITNADLDNKINFHGHIFDIQNPQLYIGEDSNLTHASNAKDLAYLIYTSGSTGKPKGAMVEHAGLVNHIYSKINELDIDSNSIISQNSSHCFDISMWQYLTALAAGGTTVIFTNDIVINMNTFIEGIIKEKITVLQIVPSYLSVMLDYLEANNRSISELRYIVSIGETVKPKLVERWFKLYSSISFVNAYGPTEAADAITHYKMKELPDSSSISIGKPIQNMKIYIVNEQMQLCPIGIKGEICVAGIGVGRGYINDAEKTKQKFMINPFDENKLEKLYKTGDLGRWLEDGNIEFFGRKDYQVKIRGFRIELEEIETILAKYSEIKQTVVISRQDLNGEYYIVSYYVAYNKIDVVELKAFLLSYLPDYMIPSYFIHMEQMPLLPNGKIDRRLLPEPEGNITAATAYVAPSNEIEEVLVGIWQKILMVDNIGINHNFFEMGGNSIKLITLVSKIAEAFDVELSHKQLFEAPTIRGIAQILIKGEFKEQNPLTLLNTKTEKNVFLFPPIGGYGLVYKDMADILEEYSWYSFNYIADNDYSLSAYVKYITEVQNSGSFVLAGWSAGGNLAFEVSKALEKQGYTVSDLILIDVPRILDSMEYSNEEIKNIANGNLQQAMEDEFYRDYLSKNEFVRNKVLNMMENYMTYYYNHMQNSGTLNANIHFILSTDKVEDNQEDTREYWNTATNGMYKKYQGIGSHPYMLYKGQVEQNSKIILQILKEIFVE